MLSRRGPQQRNNISQQLVLGPTDSPLSAAMRKKMEESAYDRHQTRLDEMVKVKIYFDLLMASVGAESTIHSI
jgi:hypothetical protein